MSKSTSRDSHGFSALDFPDFFLPTFTLPLSHQHVGHSEPDSPEDGKSEISDETGYTSAEESLESVPHHQPEIRSNTPVVVWSVAAPNDLQVDSSQHSHAQPDETSIPSVAAHRPSTTSSVGDTKWKDEERQALHALELSKQTAHEEEKNSQDQRRTGLEVIYERQIDFKKSRGLWHQSLPLRMDRLPAVANSLSAGQTQTQQSSGTLHHNNMPQAPASLPAPALLHETRLSQTLSNTSHPQRVLASGSPPPLDPSQRSFRRLLAPESVRPRARSGSGGNLSIRDASRTREDLSVARSGELCEACQIVGPQRSHCNVCNFVLCDDCWNAQLVHKSNRLAVGSIPHEKTEHHVARKVQDVLTPHLTDEDREKLHTADIDTTWFGVVREENELPLFRDYGRYANLISATKDSRLVTPVSLISDPSETLYPSLVSFVGQTGAGKSTLIKLLVDLGSEEGERFPTPVVGAAGRDVATSEDVHLYLDPESSKSQAPLLFADCEGLEGGEREPVGAKLKKRLEKQAKQETAAGVRRVQRLKYTSERELIWADTARKQSREYAVAHLYPRLLHTFSDVIVFVLKNPRVIESVLERLVDWAQAALEKSSNQPVLPHAIIALNASENDIPEELWDVDSATTALLESLSRTVFQNTTFRRHAQFWRERDRQIESVEQLVLSYYSSLRVIRIPTTGRPNLIRRQVEKLSGMVRWASGQSRQRKADLRMLLDADEFQPYLQFAFDHFATDLNTPFDFVQASFANSPIPNNFGGNILKLALQVMECWSDTPGFGTMIFEELGYVVASCIMLDAARNKIRGNDEQIFPDYLEHLDNALENFCDRHWPCEFTSPKGKCVNVRSGHGAKGHQQKSGKLLADGDYVSSFVFEEYRQRFQEDTYYKLKLLRKRVQSRIEDGASEERATAEVHREFVLPAFFEHASQGDPRAFISHTVCFCCLLEPPEHALPCGHILCTPCLKTYGRSHLRGHVEVADCPLERRRLFRRPWSVYLKPQTCGVRVLTLDGGGVRGIVELEILKQIQNELGGRVNVQNFFDLIVGTSTGGIIALGLTARNWTLDECITQFEGLCCKAFTKRRGIDVPLVSWLVSNYNHSKYETHPLQEALISAFSNEQYLFGGTRTEPRTMDVKVAVTTTSAGGQGVVLANYNRMCLEKLSYHFQRPEKLRGELKTWEAARATSAAPTYFKPFCHDASKQVYSDGGIYHNNPINIAERERKLIWPNQSDEEPDIILSIGTMFCSKQKDNRILRWASSSKGIISHGRNLSNMAQNHLHASLDSERTWGDYLSVKDPTPANEGRYVRINPELEDQPPKLDEVDELRSLRDRTRDLVGEDPMIKALARRLVATCFYLTVSGEVKEDAYQDLFEISGYFHCRFFPGTEVEELGKYIKRNANAGHDAHFLIQEEGTSSGLTQVVPLNVRTVNRMITHGDFRIEKPVQIRRSNKLSRTEISLCLTRDTSYPISGFPRCLHNSKPGLTGIASRHALASTNSFRWAGRSNSQQERRYGWTPPNTLPPMEKADMIARYSDAGHLLGNTTESVLRRAESAQKRRLKTRGLRDTAAHTTAGVELPTVETLSDRYFTAVEDWSSVEAVSLFLSVRKGDLVRIIHKSEDGLWLGHLSNDSEQRWIPSSCLQPAGSDAHERFNRRELDAADELPRPPPSELEATLLPSE